LSRCEERPPADPNASSGVGAAGIGGTTASRRQPELNPAESPLAWLRRRKDKDGAALIGDAEFQAGERLRADFWFAGLTPRVTTNWSAVGGSGRAGPGLGLDLKDNIVAARERVHRALAAVGPELAGVLIDVCCHLKGLKDAERQAGWPARSGKVVLQLALRRLARHYGFDPRGRRGPGRARAPLGRIGLPAHARAAEPLSGCACAHAAPASACAARASARMRSTIAANPFERCGVRCSLRPSSRKIACASVARISSGCLP
jgi:hypothetical protein